MITAFPEFENLPELPDDLADAFDGMKLAILHHKYDGWRAISRADVVGMLRMLRDLARSEPAESAR
jgi:hypothetical protein